MTCGQGVAWRGSDGAKTIGMVCFHEKRGQHPHHRPCTRITPIVVMVVGEWTVYGSEAAFRAASPSSTFEEGCGRFRGAIRCKKHCTSVGRCNWDRTTLSSSSSSPCYPPVLSGGWQLHPLCVREGANHPPPEGVGVSKHDVMSYLTALWPSMRGSVRGGKRVPSAAFCSQANIEPLKNNARKKHSLKNKCQTCNKKLNPRKYFF